MNLFDAIHSEDELRAADEGMRLQRDTVAQLRRVTYERGMQRTYQAMVDSVADWRPPELPDLDAFDEIIVDLETDGLRWWAGDRMIGAGMWTPDGQTRYFPLRHNVGPNIDPAVFFEWVRRAWRGKRITNIRTKFDLHMFRADGLDLEAIGCTFGDVAHYAALLDDQRRQFNQEALAKEYLPEDVIGKLKSANGFDLDPSSYKKYPGGLVAQRAESDVLVVSMLKRVFWDLMTQQDLHRVRELEDQVIPVVVEMEQNGVPLDMVLLQQWCRDSERALTAALDRFGKATGIRPETAGKKDQIATGLKRIGIETPDQSIADEHLERYDVPAVYDLREAIALASLRSKFLVKFWDSCQGDGILRYELHQLPYQDDTEGGGGAVSGRFSSAAMTYYDEHGTQKKHGANIQQVFGVKSQSSAKRTFNPTAPYIVRKLFKADTKTNPNARWMSSDMRQIEYRRFVHYSEAPQLLASYDRDPLTDYHVLVHGLIVEHTGKDFERTHVKNLNFASLYGAGLPKIAFMVGEIDGVVYADIKRMQAEARKARAAKDFSAAKRWSKAAYNDPRIAGTRSLYETYHKMFPDVKRLLDLATKTAEERGYVMTILGRRARFRPGDRTYSALNRVIQGTAAEDNKRALIDVHRSRKELGFTPRFTVHDELGGDLADAGMLPRMADFLNQPRLPSRVAILWDTHIGESWADCK